MSEERKRAKEEALKIMRESKEMESLENFLINNSYEFDIEKMQKDEKTSKLRPIKHRYRVRYLTWEEQDELAEKKKKKYLELINEVDDKGNPVNLTEREWRKKYKSQGRTELDDIEKEIEKIQKEINGLYVRLTKSPIEKEKNDLEAKIRKLKDKLDSCFADRIDLLFYTIERQIIFFVNSYAAYLALERKEGDKWVKAFDNFEDFKDSNDIKLQNTAIRVLASVL